MPAGTAEDQRRMKYKTRTRESDKTQNYEKVTIGNLGSNFFCGVEGLRL